LKKKTAGKSVVLFGDVSLKKRRRRPYFQELGGKKARQQNFRKKNQNGRKTNCGANSKERKGKQEHEQTRMCHEGGRM